MASQRVSPAQAVSSPHHLAPLALQSHQTRFRWMMAVLIAMTAGYLDGYGLLFLKTFVSFMSGNTTSTGLNFGQGDLAAALPTAVAILTFVTGSFLGNLFLQSRLRHSHRILFGLIAAAIAAVALLQRSGFLDSVFEIAVMCTAMGMTNPAISKIGGESVSLTFVTGTLNRIGGHLASSASRQPVKDAQGPRDTHLVRALIETTVWIGFVGGAVLSGIAGANSRSWGLLPPCCMMLALGVFSEASS